MGDGDDFNPERHDATFDFDRQDAMLTTTYREGLDDDNLNSTQLTRMRRRIESTLLDFGLLSENLDWDEREYLFGDTVWGYDRPDLNQTVSDVIEFLFLAQTRRGDDWVREESGHHNPLFEKQLERGLRAAYLKHDLLLEDIDLEVDSRPNPDPERVHALITAGGPLPQWVLEVAHERGWVDAADHREFLAEQIEKNANR